LEVLFQRLAHEQLTVRESSIKAFASLLSRSDEATTISTLMQTLESLKSGAGHGEIQLGEVRLLSAGQAEGALGLGLTILKQIPADLLTLHWRACVDTLDKYLAHPASTVRQTTSTIFECVAGRVTSTGSMLPTVMGVLTKGCDNSSSDQRLTWEWREGRLLAFELILRRLVRGHLAHLLQMELRLEIKSPEFAEGSGGSPLPLWPQRSVKSHKRTTVKDDFSAIDRLRTESKGELRGLWEQLLSYTVNCLSDPRWELRRMGDQVPNPKSLTLIF